MYSRRRIIELARELRRKSTPSERLLWAELRNRQLKGAKFFRQHPLIYEEDRGRLYFFIPDFYSAEHKLVIELDGDIHDQQQEYDRERDLIVSRLGLMVIRFRNEETDEMERLLGEIESYL